MRNFLAAAVLFVTASAASAAATIPMYDLPLKNGEARDSVYKMSEHKNGVFVLEAFSINCGYCHQNAPAVDALATEYASEPRVQVLDLGLDRTDAAFDEWIAQHSPNHPVVQDTNRRIYNALRTANGIPQVFVVNCKGEMVGNHVGTWGGAEKKIRGFIQRALATTCEPTIQ